MRDLKKVRCARGLRQADVARAAGVHQSTISRWERGVLTSPPERGRQILDAIDALRKQTPTEDLRTEAAAVHSLLMTITTEARAGADGETLGHLAKLASSRQRRVLRCLSPPGGAS